MRRNIYLLITGFEAGLLFSLLPLSIGPTIFQIAAEFIGLFGLICLLIGTFIIGWNKWRTVSRFWIGPALCSAVCITSFVVGTKYGIFAFEKTWQLKHHINDYVRITDAIQRGAIPCGTTRTAINTTNLPPHIRNIVAARFPDGSTSIEFFSKNSSALWHIGYLYMNSSGTNSSIASDEQQLWRLYHITGDWYEFSD
jgi:hypothetical protein